MRRATVQAAVVAVIALFAMTALADVPAMINYQGHLTDNAGNPLDTTVSMTFTIYDDSTGGNLQWSETQAGVTVTGGLFTVRPGSVNPIPDTAFADSERWLGIAVGADPEITPRTRLTSAPYSLRVSTVDGASGGTITGPVTFEGDGRQPYIVTIVGHMVSTGTTISGDLVVTGKATIGPNNTNDGLNAFVAGNGCVAGANASQSVISGGLNNSVQQSTATIAGGQDNQATQSWAFIGGGLGNTADGYYTGVCSGSGNTASGNHAFVGGGQVNDAEGNYSVVAGGGGPVYDQRNLASGDYSAIGGGDGNTASGPRSTICGGHLNKARGDYSVVCGGGGSAAADSNAANGHYSAICGGQSNIIAGSDIWATTWAFIGGGTHNVVNDNSGVVCGGQYNLAGGTVATVCGGQNNVAGGPSEPYATVSGGYHNEATGNRSTVPGGHRNAARGYYSFAAGNQAKANHAGSFVLSANSSLGSDSVRSGGNEQMVLRADGGIYLTNTGELAPYNSSRIITTRGGAYLSGNGTTWTNSSDRNKKENFTEIDGAEILRKLSELSITRWNYKDEADNVTHIGPVAQDFYALFGLGGDDLTISTIDPAGIALAAIQALQKKNGALEAEVAELKALVQRLLAERQ